MRKVLELKGYKSLRALNAFHALMLGLKMLPAYAGERYLDFAKRIDEMPEADQKTMIKEAALLVNLDKEDLEALVCFCTDKNGIPYTSENMNNLAPNELVEVIVAVCWQISQIKLDLVTEDEKKN